VVDARTGLAMWLRGGRTQRGLSLDDVARVTKIQARILERLEAGKLDGLPADVFVRGFVRSFARCVGLDETESLKRYVACGDSKSAVAGPAARAVIDAMADLVPSSARTGPRVLRDDPGTESMPLTDDGAVDVLAAGSAAGWSPTGDPASVEPTPSADSVQPVEPMVASIVESIVASIAAPDTEAPTPAEGPAAVTLDGKKKRARRSTGTAKGRGKRKPMADGTPWNASPVVPAAAATTDVTSAPASDAAICAEVIATPVTPVIDGSLHELSAVSAATATCVEPSTALPVAVLDPPAIPDSVELSSASEAWLPKMPAPSAAASVPWRRTGYVTSAPVANIVAVIDDADPDSAERDLEDRRSTKEPRRSFLPPILLDREDRSARQGGLTLAVIILLIAATLTLSYLMRRPSSSGDGVTQLETTSLLA